MVNLICIFERVYKKVYLYICVKLIVICIMVIIYLNFNGKKYNDSWSNNVLDTSIENIL